MKIKIHPRIGFHTAGASGNPSGIGQHYVKYLHDQDIPVVITCADGTVGLGDALSDHHENDILIFRVVRDRHESFAVPDYEVSPKEAAVKYWNLISAFIATEVRENRDKIWVAFGNELDQDRARWIFSWSLEMCRLMNANGYKAVGPNWAAGTPRLDAWESTSALDFLRYCASNRNQAAVGIHEYSYELDDLFAGEGSKVGRYRHIIQGCRRAGIGRPVILIKEFGYTETKVPDPKTIVDDIKDLYRRYPDYPPATLWWLGPGYKGIANRLQPAIAEVGKFVAGTLVEFDLETSGTEPERPGDANGRVEDGIDGAAQPKRHFESRRGIELDFFKLLPDRSDFRVDESIWFEFRYNNLLGQDIEYGGMGVAVHKWDGNQWRFVYYQHSFKGRLRPQGGPPSSGASHNDHWRAGDVGIFALTPFLTFDPEATVKREKPDDISQGFFMAEPVYVRVGGRLEPGGLVDRPPAPLFEGEVAGGGDGDVPGEPREPELPDDVRLGEGDDSGENDNAGDRADEKVGDLARFLWKAGVEKRLIDLNPEAALQRIIFRDGLVPVSAEFRTTFDGQPYGVQLAEHLGTGEKRVYYAPVGHWENVRYITDFAEVPVITTPRPDTKPSGDELPDEPDLNDVWPTAFEFKFWPTSSKKLIQPFGARPEYYEQFGLPGHEGVDLAAPLGEPYFAVAPGTVIKVSDQRWDGQPSAYGWHVIVEHQDGFSTLYAHAASEIPVQVGQHVDGGQILAYSGNTGNASGAHLHLTLKLKDYQLDGWPPGYMDPWPYLEPLYNDLIPPMTHLSEGYLWARSLDLRANDLAIATLNLNMRREPNGDSELVGVVKKDSVVRILEQEPVNGYLYCEASLPPGDQPKDIRERPSPETIDLLPYIAGDGRQYEVRNAWGSQERFQTQWDGTTVYQKKNAQWEQFFFDNDFIYRDIDTSPGGGRYYRLKDPDLQRGSRWLRRHMAVGDTYTQSRHVQFYDKSDGSPSAANSGQVTNVMKLVAHHDRFKFKTGLELPDVIELLWVDGGERYFYAKDFGLVGWARTHDDPNSPPWSAISEIHAPGAREPFNRETVIVR